MAGTPPRRHTRFIDAGDEAAQELTAIVDAMRPHVVVTYDQEGGYGHPDHINAHTVTTAAVAASRWRVPKLYWTVMSTSAMTAGIEALTGFPADWSKPNPAEIPFGYADDQIDAVIDATAYIDAKVAALQAHATQVTVAPNRRSCALSNGMALPILAEEHYVLAAGPAGDKDERGWETDLLAGLNLG
jgi:N-acetyl-1-D-myo-inositol-2-amino-2-deoxy-alpha-D-glucopyranoside deacetylase